MKDKLWFFVSARYFSVNNFIANTDFDDGDQGVDDQFIKSALLASHLADHAEVEVRRLPRRGGQVPRPRHAERLGLRDGGDAVVLAGVSHEPGAS